MVSKINQQSLLIYIISFLGQLSMAAINLGLIFFMKAVFLLDPQSIGLFAAISALSYLVGILVLKHLVSSFPPPKTILLAAIGMLFSGSAVLIVKTAWPAFILYGLYGIFMSFYWPPVMGWLSRDKEKKELGKTIANFNLSWTWGVLAGPFIAGLLSEKSPVYAIEAAGGIMLIVVIMLAVVSRLPSISAVPSNHDHKKAINQKDTSTYLRYVCWVGLISGYFVFGITMNIFPLYAQDILHMPESAIGFLLLIRGLVTALIFMVMGKFHIWQFRFLSIVVFQALLAASLLVGLIADTVILLTLFFTLFGISFSGIYTISIFHGAAGSSDREHRMAIHEVMLTIGIVSGSLLGGVLYQQMSYSSVMVFCLIVTAAAAAVQTAVFLGNRAGSKHKTAAMM
ncbi:MAG: MFS transporter [Spirochaetes bacterium]|nr:MFS transporter [Spirochaetota bacterium]